MNAASTAKGFHDRHGDYWGHYEVISNSKGRVSGYALVDVVATMGVVQVAEQLGLATREQLMEAYGPLTEYHN